MEGTEVALKEIALPTKDLEEFLPYHAVRADLLRQSGRTGEARVAYDAALALNPGPAERLWLERRKKELSRN